MNQIATIPFHMQKMIDWTPQTSGNSEPGILGKTEQTTMQHWVLQYAV